ncbi:MAG TPA: hypothetical protein DDY04_01835 [Bacteroidales bacterium]|nr:hypothetical protein [Bacteroidales bacterium]
METIEVGKHCKITVIDHVPCIKIKWFGFPPSEEFKKGCNTALDLLVKYSFTKILTDNREAKVFAVEDQKWLNNEWLPKAQALGYRGSATLLPDDPFITFAIKNITAKRDPKMFATKFFTDEKEALRWLKQI